MRRTLESLVSIAVVLVLVTSSCSDDPSAGDSAQSSTTEAPDDGDHAHDPGAIEGVAVIEIESNDHTTDPVDYDTDPPAGGPHAPRWLACGVYDEPVPNENAVHSLEHGAVWITYGDIGDDVEVLESLAEESGRILVSPYPALGEGEIVASSWGHQLRLDDVDDSRLAEFLHLAVDSPDAPEPGASCS